MYETTRPIETKITLETHVMTLLEGMIADFRCKKLPPPKVFNSPHDCKAAWRGEWLGIPPW